MDEIRRQDRTLFLKELAAPIRLAGLLLCLWLLYATLFEHDLIPIPFMRPTFAFVIGGYIVTTAYQSSVKKRFRNERFRQLWEGCRDRHTRFEEVLKKMRREKIADLVEMPKNVHNTAEGLYCALRRADMMSEEILRTEQDMLHNPPVWQVKTNDPQSRELYKAADSNIAEYRRYYSGVMAGVQRTEAQSAYFMTALDTFRIKMLGYRMVGKSPEMNTANLMSAITEAKMQLSSIDKALEELELGPYPKMIAAMPNVPGVPPQPPIAALDQERLRALHELESEEPPLQQG
jgi:hypothetical protein